MCANEVVGLNLCKTIPKLKVGVGIVVMEIVNLDLLKAMIFTCERLQIVYIYIYKSKPILQPK